jgi:hypothetical protein
MLITFLLLACTATPSDAVETGDTADTGADEREPLDVPCSLQLPFGAGDTMQWGAVLEGRTVPAEGCEEGAPCLLSDGRTVEAEWFNVNPDDEMESYWVAGYESIRNENADPTTRAWVSVQRESPNVGECRITLL